jgi:2-carboxy-1,4-naphthoquinone phytyltransferase
MTSPALAPAINKKLWMAAIKPPMYSVAVMPIWWGTAIAHYETQQLNGLIFGLFLGAAVLLLGWENLANDVFDADTGVDVNKHHSLVNLTRNRGLILALANLFLGLGIGGILAIAVLQQDATVLALVLGCCLLGYVYQGPPFRLGYQGLGEILCFFAFGPLAVGAAYYSQAQAFSSSSLVASVVLGLTTSLILFCSHFHQVADDLAAGKRSPIVRLGTKRGAQLLPVICGVCFGLMAVLVLGGWAPAWALLGLAGLPWAVQLCRQVGRYHDRPEQVMNCKFIAVALHFWSGLLFGLGYFIG